MSLENCKASDFPSGLFSPPKDGQDYLYGAKDKLNIVSKVAKTRFSIYLAYAPSVKQNVIIKAFPFKNERSSSAYRQEARFSDLEHRNIIRFFHCEKEKTIIAPDGECARVSLIIMEYAPYGNFFSLLHNPNVVFEDRLLRTYFRQLIEGLEYLQAQGVAHLDLRLENLLLGQNYVLKICDFIHSWKKDDPCVIGKGSKYLRAPELITRDCKDPMAADIFSAGILLFIMKCGGQYPHLENEEYEGVNLYELMQNNPQAFWQKHCQIQGREPNFFSDDFKELFLAMTKAKPEERAKIEDIKHSEWYKGPVYSNTELKKLMKKALDPKNA